MIAVSTFDTVGGLIILAVVAVVAITDRVCRHPLPSGRRADAARLPGNARHCGRVEAGNFPAAEARTREGRGADGGAASSAAGPSREWRL